jgi:GTP:adenosylcobinamide-phosphate guanylyltransferase
VKANLKLYLAAAILGTIILVSLYISKQTTDLAGLAIAMAQTAGFIVVVFLLGHGYVLDMTHSVHHLPLPPIYY